MSEQARWEIAEAGIVRSAILAQRQRLAQQRAPLAADIAAAPARLQVLNARVKT